MKKKYPYLTLLSVAGIFLTSLLYADESGDGEGNDYDSDNEKGCNNDDSET